MDRLTLMDRIARLDVLVIGDVCLDNFQEGRTTRDCPDAPVPVVDLIHAVLCPGGAANVAVNATTLGASVAIASVIGADETASRLSEVLAKMQISVDGLVTSPDRGTVSKARVISNDRLLCRIDYGSTEPINENDLDALMDRISAYWRDADVVLISDYSLGSMSVDLVARLIELQAHYPKPVAVNAKGVRHSIYRPLRPILSTMNYREALDLAGLPAKDDDQTRAEIVAGMPDLLLNRTGGKVVAVTLDKDGAMVVDRENRPARTQAKQVPSPHVSGCGDSYFTAFALALASGASRYSAADFAQDVANVVVTKHYTAFCNRAEALGAGFMSGKRVVLAAGCFDMLHAGHIALLKAAKAAGDYLVVGINSDATVTRLKGNDRPIQSAEERGRALIDLDWVDCVIEFEEDYPHHLIQHVSPQVYVKGSDYSADELPEARLLRSMGAEILIVPRLEGYSTTKTIEAMKRGL